MRANTDWFRDARWGVFTHYLGSNENPESPDDWNRQVDAFDVKGLADQFESIGAPYCFITLGQNSGHYIAPNAAYDAVVGGPSKLSKRDLVSDIHAALAPRGIALLVYLPSGAPAADKRAADAFGWEWGFEGGWPHGWQKRTGKRLADFQRKWEAVIREWSLRWGTKIRGWWFDGCYFADEMYRHADAPNFASFAAAAKAGNPDSLVAFNPGQDVAVCMDEHEDYTAGEVATHFLVPPGRFVGGCQFHVLSYLGKSWAAPRGDVGRADREVGADPAGVRGCAQGAAEGD